MSHAKITQVQKILLKLVPNDVERISLLKQLLEKEGIVVQTGGVTESGGVEKRS